MKTVLAIIQVDDSVEDVSNLSPGDIKNVAVISGIHPMYYRDVRTFLAHWIAGINARQKWEIFSENFFKLFTESGFVDEKGIHTDEYDVGSICRFIIKNKETIMPQSFKQSAFSGMLIGALKMGASTMRKGKDIEVDWPKIASYAKPMAEIILTQVALAEHRREIMQPIINQYFDENPIVINQPTSDN